MNLSKFGKSKKEPSELHSAEVMFKDIELDDDTLVMTGAGETRDICRVPVHEIVSVVLNIDTIQDDGIGGSISVRQSAIQPRVGPTQKYHEATFREENAELVKSIVKRMKSKNQDIKIRTMNVVDDAFRSGFFMHQKIA